MNRVCEYCFSLKPRMVNLQKMNYRDVNMVQRDVIIFI